MKGINVIRLFPRWWQLKMKHCYMNRTLTHIFIFIILSVKGFSQSQFVIKIDSTCFQENGVEVLGGKFGLYGDMKIPKHPFWVKDTLIKDLEFKKEQVLKLEDMHYTLRFIPDDSTQQIHSVSIHPQNKYVTLSCFFFDKSYPLNLRRMKHNDCLTLVSRYAGPTNMNTAIRIISLIIVKKRGNYYASYWESSTNEQGLITLDLPIYTTQGKDIKIDENYIKLNNGQLGVIEEFWGSMNTYWLDNDYRSIPSQTIIYDKNGYISFQSKEYISAILWKKLN